MAERGFDIEADLAFQGVRLNIPPFCKGKDQFGESELVETRRIASLRIHIERAMEEIKNFHIFDRPFYHHHLEILVIKCSLFVLY